MSDRMTVSGFIKKLEEHKKEIGCDGTRIGSHKLKSSIGFYCDEIEMYFELESIEPQNLIGCACQSGITINLKNPEKL